MKYFSLFPVVLDSTRFKPERSMRTVSLSTRLMDRSMSTDVARLLHDRRMSTVSDSTRTTTAVVLLLHAVRPKIL